MNTVFKNANDFLKGGKNLIFLKVYLPLKPA